MPAKWDEIFALQAQTDRSTTRWSALGGLHIVGTERHEARRIDNQLRGRAGRQGDPGCSRFFLSLQDDLLRIFGGERIQNLMLRLGMEEDVPIESQADHQAHRQGARRPVEAQNFDARKHLLEYDDVMNKQRQAVYGMRRAVARRRGPEGADPGHGRRHRRHVRRPALPRESPSRRVGPGRPAHRHPQPVRPQDRHRRSWPRMSRGEIEETDLRAAARRSTRRKKTWSAPR